MGWGHCGTDANGREIGYNVDATCDHPGCNEPIHRGLAYVCGRDMHGDTEMGCAGYFCEKHVTWTRMADDDGMWSQVCHECHEAAVAEIPQLDFDEREEAGAATEGNDRFTKSPSEYPSTNQTEPTKGGVRRLTTQQ